jgi:hypothetical protein
VIPASCGAAAVNPNAQCSLGPMQYGMPGILSRYSALGQGGQALLQGFQFSGAYAFAKYTTLVSISNNNNLHEGFGPSASNPHHRFTFSGIWELPKYKGSQWLVRGASMDGSFRQSCRCRPAGRPALRFGTLDIEGDGTFVYRLPGTGVSSFGNGFSASDIRSRQLNSTVPAGRILADRNSDRTSA